MDNARANYIGPVLSHSSIGAYERCQRAWLYRYKTDWIPGDIRWAIKVESKLAPEATTAGSIVDQVITEGLRAIHAGGVWFEDPYSRAIEIGSERVAFTRRWIEAVRNRMPWPTGEQPLERFYFNEAWTKEEAAALKDSLRKYLQIFEGDDALEIATMTPKDCWRLPVDGFPVVFMWPDPAGSGEILPVYNKYDFALHTPNETIIWDWKAGNPDHGDDNVLDQLHRYADFAHHTWGAEYANIRLIPLWLQNGRSDRYSVSDDRLKGLWSSAKALHDLLVKRDLSVDQGADPFKLFPPTENSKQCARCQYRSCPARSA